MNQADEQVLQRIATPDDLNTLWQYHVDSHPGDDRWVRWRKEYIGYNQTGAARTYAVVVDGVAVGEGTLLFDPACSAIDGRTILADGTAVVNLNALRIRKPWEGRGYISAMVGLMEQHARQAGFSRITIGVDACETRNRAIYAHWGYTRLLFTEEEDGEQVLYYEKSL
ncbi:MAG: GNAT family N-acetyltransferase [Clostridia bacterium]|nr:GNAT family N-acetyltransferase [Clostridia bacterium]